MRLLLLGLLLLSLLLLLLLLLSNGYMALLVVRRLLVHPAGVALGIVLVVCINVRRRHHLGRAGRVAAMYVFNSICQFGIGRRNVGIMRV